MKHLIYQGHVYRLAANELPEDGETLPVKAVNPLQHVTGAIPRQLRSQFGLPEDNTFLNKVQVAKGYKIINTGDPKLGYTITGNLVIAEDVHIDEDQFGPPPYSFEAIIKVTDDENAKELKEEVEHVEIKSSETRD